MKESRRRAESGSERVRASLQCPLPPSLGHLPHPLPGCALLYFFLPCLHCFSVHLTRFSFWFVPLLSMSSTALLLCYLHIYLPIDLAVPYFPHSRCCCFLPALYSLISAQWFSISFAVPQPSSAFAAFRKLCSILSNLFPPSSPAPCHLLWSLPPPMPHPLTGHGWDPQTDQRCVSLMWVNYLVIAVKTCEILLSSDFKTIRLKTDKLIPV